MKIHNCAQGSSEWFALRAGIPTASGFVNVITPTGKPCKGERTDHYMCELLAERIMGHPIDTFASVWMERGSELETSAASFYEFQCDCTTERVGFITNDAGTIGASPDRLVGDDGLLEIKVPAPGTHVAYLLFKDVDRSYYPQVQGQLWIAERQWLDILSYNPEMPPTIVHVERDEEFIKTLAEGVTSFALRLEQTYDELQESGLLVPKMKRESSLIAMLKESLREINRVKGLEIGANDIPV